MYYWRCVDILHGEDVYQDQQSHSVSVKGHSTLPYRAVNTCEDCSRCSC